ncbi:BppU family phage baseplate upper protein [Clostridium perfringens]
MSEIGLNINVDSYNNEGIKTIKGNNNAEIYKLYILKNKRRLSLVGKTVKLGYVMAGTTNGDVIENLNITNAEQGEITFPITNRISKQDGIYSCQLAIYGADGFLEHTATFGLTVEANIFTKIAGEIENSKDLTYIERILEEAKTVSGELKTNIPVATNINSSLESNISSASNINTTLADTTEKSKVAATDAIEKKSQLEKSITKAKEFIDGLDGSQNIPGIRMELTELQNGLKSNQALAYKGSSINAENTLEGRTEGMRIDGITLLNCILTPIINRTYTANSTQQMYNYKVLRKANATYTIIAFISKNTLNNSFSLLSWGRTSNGNPIAISNGEKGLIKKSFTTNYNTEDWFLELWKENTTGEIKIDYMMVLEGDWTNKDVPSYFEGIKSFGEAEKVEDKYKISILSHNYNLYDLEKAKKISANNVTFNKDGSVEFYQGGERFIIGNDFIPNTQYTVTFTGISGQCKFNFHYTDGSDEPFGFLGEVEATSNINKTLKEIRSSWTTGEKSTVNKIQVIKGNQKLPYISAKQNKKDILIKEPLREGDYLYEDNEQVKVDRESGQYTITSNERITKENTLINITRFYIDTQCKNKVNTRNIICNNFNSNGTWWDRDEIGMYWDTSIQGRLWFHIPKTKFNDVESFRNFLKANPTTIVYQLATPVTEVVENCVDIDLDTFQDKTYFSIENSLPGTLDFKVPSNIASVVQNTAKEVNNIWDVINNLLVPSLIDINKNVALATIKNNLK